MEIKEIIKRNYQAQIRRKLITPSIHICTFMNKLKEEVQELEASQWDALLDDVSPVIDEKELADVTLVCFAIAEHYKIDLIKEMENKMLFNETRED